ncbi:MAG TPA: hypothetical protein ENJ95_03190 [Bacteroidetes bacterium]|nr:hypothetical protein [Bacteroidota bacterium]
MNNNDKFAYPTPEDGGKATRRVSVPYFWRGGTYGAERFWNEPMNWYNRFVPGWFDVVVISGEYAHDGYFPIIEEFANDIAQLIIEPGGKLTVGMLGKLCVDGLGKKGLGILNEGDLVIDGELTVHRTLFASVRNKGLIFNNGSFAIDKNEDNGIIHSSSGRFENYGEFLFL